MAHDDTSEERGAKKSSWDGIDLPRELQPERSCPTVAASAAAPHRTFGYPAVTALVAALVYRWFGLAFLRRGGVDVDLLAALALVATGLFTFLR